MENVVVVEAEQVTLIEVSNDDVVVVEAGQQGLPGKDGRGIKISTDPLNRLIQGSDEGLYVSNDLIQDPLAYYILAKA